VHRTIDLTEREAGGAASNGASNFLEGPEQAKGLNHEKDEDDDNDVMFPFTLCYSKQHFSFRFPERSLHTVDKAIGPLLYPLPFRSSCEPVSQIK
jgi:hypothetical protein